MLMYLFSGLLAVSVQQLICLESLGALEPVVYTVQLSVSCKEKEAQALVQSYLQRELRSLKDVSIVNSGARHEVEVQVLELLNRRENSVGYAISLLVMRRFPSKEYFKLPVFRGRLTAAEIAAAETGTKGYVLIETSGLYSCAAEDLRQICERIVVGIDSEVIEFDRKTSRAFEPILEELEKKQRSTSPTP